VQLNTARRAGPSAPAGTFSPRQWLHVKYKKKSFAKILAAVDDRRKIILLQRVENVPKTFLEKSGRGVKVTSFDLSEPVVPSLIC